jgi:hypothetical protein
MAEQLRGHPAFLTGIGFVGDLTLKHRPPQLRRPAAYRAISVPIAPFRCFAIANALAVLVMFFGIMAALTCSAWPSIRAFGFSFLWTQIWNLVTQKFGAVAPIYGTLVTSAIAMFIAVPVGIGIAIFLTELCPLTRCWPAAPPGWLPDVDSDSEAITTIENEQVGGDTLH